LNIQTAGGDINTIATTIGNQYLSSPSLKPSFTASGDPRSFGTFSGASFPLSAGCSSANQGCTPLTSGFVLSTGLASDLARSDISAFEGSVPRGTCLRQAGTLQEGSGCTQLPYDSTSISASFTAATQVRVSGWCVCVVSVRACAPLLCLCVRVVSVRACAPLLCLCVRVRVCGAGLVVD
jgi:hypothetical protein